MQASGLQTIKAIETAYKGYRFRSRLEARWGVFLDNLGVKWEYEPEGFNLAEAGWYLPDFWLPQYGWWVEIKPVHFLPENKERCEALLACTGAPVLLIAGNPWPEEYDISVFGQNEFCPIDFDGQPLVCNQWASWGLTPDFPNLSVVRQFNQGNHCWSLLVHGDANRDDPEQRFHWPCTHNNFCQDVFCPLMVAYTAARSARFEHGERP